jgi:hypothetical protein
MDLTNSTGALVGNETYQYDPYGQLIVQPHTAALRTNAWRYASGYYDVSTGLSPGCTSLGSGIMMRRRGDGRSAIRLGGV